MVLVFGRLVMIFSDFALTPALVQRPVLTDKDRSTAFWTSIGGHQAPPSSVSRFRGNRVSLRTTRVQPLFIAFSFSFLLLSLGCDAGCVADARPRFRSLEIRNIIGTVAGASWRSFLRSSASDRGRSSLCRSRRTVRRRSSSGSCPPGGRVSPSRARACAVPQVQRQRFRHTDAHVSHFEPRQFSRWSCARPGFSGCVPAFLQPGHLSAEQPFGAHSRGLVSGVLADSR